MESGGITQLLDPAFSSQEEQDKKLEEEFSNFFLESELIDIVLEDDEE